MEPLEQKEMSGFKSKKSSESKSSAPYVLNIQCKEKSKLQKSKIKKMYKAAIEYSLG